MQSLRGGDGEGPSGQHFCSHFVLDDGTVEYGGKEVESFPVKHNGFWKGMVEGCYVVSYYCPACKVIVIPVDRKSTRL